MRVQKIRSVVDAVETQGRFILHLACGHNVSVTRGAIAKMPVTQAVAMIQRDAEWNCKVCPDPAPVSPAEVRAAKTPTQLWKEAGEP